MTNMPKEVTLDADDLAALGKLEAAQQGVAAFVQQVTLAGERRNAEVFEQGKAFWKAMGKKYDLDIDHVSYQPKDGKLVPVMVKL